MALDTKPTIFTSLAVEALREITSDETLEQLDSGSVILLGGATVTLPAASKQKGMKFTFIISDGASDSNIKPASGDGIIGAINDGSDSGAYITYDGTDDDYLASASASNSVGDRVTLVSDGSGDWYITEGAGVWTQTT